MQGTYYTTHNTNLLMFGSLLIVLLILVIRMAWLRKQRRIQKAYDAMIAARREYERVGDSFTVTQPIPPLYFKLFRRPLDHQVDWPGWAD